MSRDTISREQIIEAKCETAYFSSLLQNSILRDHRIPLAMTIYIIPVNEQVAREEEGIW